MSSNKLTMPSISFFILGLVVATVIANEQTTLKNSTYSDGNSSTTNTTIMNAPTITSIITNITKTNTPYINTNDTESTTVPATKVSPDENAPSGHTEMTTPAPGGSSTSTTSISTTTTNPRPPTTSSDNTGIIILIVLIIVVAVFLIACCLAHKRRNRYSIDISSRQDESNIPLSTVEPVGTAPQNGLTTFGSTETTEKKPEELETKPEAKAEAQGEQKTETDGSAVDPSAESATPASASAPTPTPAPDSSEDKPKGDVVEQNPPAPVESTVEEKTDDEAVVSNKTSVESLKETNENNSNNADFSQTRNLIFWEEVPLDCPV